MLCIRPNATHIFYSYPLTLRIKHHPSTTCHHLSTSGFKQTSEVIAWEWAATSAWWITNKPWNISWWRADGQKCKAYTNRCQPNFNFSQIATNVSMFWSRKQFSLTYLAPMLVIHIDFDPVWWKAIYTCEDFCWRCAFVGHTILSPVWSVLPR